MANAQIDGVVFMPEFRRNTELREGLTAADLASFDEPTSTIEGISQEEQAEELDREELDRSDSPYSESLDAEARRESPRRMNAAEVDSRMETAPSFSLEEANAFYSQWNAIQVSFVDEPRQAVQEADGLVASAMKRLAETFAEERARLDQQWDRSDDVSTEDLRIALRHYRSFLRRLLSI